MWPTFHRIRYFRVLWFPVASYRAKKILNHPVNNLNVKGTKHIFPPHIWTAQNEGNLRAYLEMEGREQHRDMQPVIYVIPSLTVLSYKLCFKVQRRKLMSLCQSHAKNQLFYPQFILVLLERSKRPDSQKRPHSQQALLRNKILHSRTKHFHFISFLKLNPYDGNMYDLRS